MLTSEAKVFEWEPRNLEADFFHATHYINKFYLTHSGLGTLVFEIGGDNLSDYL
jgi:hypothetical protein